MRYDDEDEDEGPQPDATLEQGLPLPVRMQGSFPLELASTPLEDIDPFYHNQRVSRGKFSSATFISNMIHNLEFKKTNLNAKTITSLEKFQLSRRISKKLNFIFFIYRKCLQLINIFKIKSM